MIDKFVNWITGNKYVDWGLWFFFIIIGVTAWVENDMSAGAYFAVAYLLAKSNYGNKT